jgi:maltooligosyltrehalose trehalohydrolase
MPFGAEVLEDGGVRFRLWAPAMQSVDLCLVRETAERCLAMTGTGDGWLERVTHDAGPGSLYHYRIDGDRQVPDRASRFQPRDVHGPSQVVNPVSFDWDDEAWQGRPWEEAVVYELHVGTFSPEGTFRGVAERLDYLADLGITAIELMPVADFPGERNWGYDGVLPFARDATYGGSADLKALVQAAHRKGLMVFLDVVYNHFGPKGNYLHRYAPRFFTERHQTPWGDGINFDGEGSRVVRDFFIHNALYWLEEYRFDGLRLDAVHAIADDSEPDILTELAQTVHTGPGKERQIHLVLENDHNAAHYLERRL